VAHVYTSWLHPIKVRQITVVGSKKMALWDDLDIRAPIKIYDKHVEKPPESQIVDTYLAYKTMAVDGGMYIPPAALNQPLKAECEHFLECLENGQEAQSDGYSGLRVVLALEAATQSMRNNSLVTPIHVPEKGAV
jgi:predicted dehydrogenase